MPEPLLYVKSFAVALIASALFELVITKRHGAATTSLNLISTPAIGVGMAIGFMVMKLQWAWPPGSALDRFLTIILPAAICIQWIAAARRTPLWLTWLMRICLVAAVPRILMHQSVYLNESGEWTLWQTYLAMIICSGLFGVVWLLMCRLSKRSSEAVSIPLSLCLSIQSAGVCVMLAGYIKGGAVAIPITAAVLGTAIAAGVMRKRGEVNIAFHSDALIGIAVVMLFSVLFFGHFFGRLTITNALAMMIAPTLCWVTEMRGIRQLSPWRVGAIRVAFVAIPLMIVLVAAKRDFDRSFAPLLKNNEKNEIQNRYARAFPIELESSSLH
ncbi:hypothetical protein SH528x_004437 [Novipirellula sp. SH528]|uniref:hypothetical protein n=1 Tax=Novipirellula sp. SH528 TaxID=3454466 RepID=UPI003FA077C6